MSEPEPLILKGINLEGFEKLVYLSDGTPEASDAICRELFSILDMTREGSGFQADERAQNVLWTRIAGAITAFLLNPRQGVTREGYIEFCRNHAQIHAIFRASSYETMDHILSCLSESAPGGGNQRTFSSEQAILKLLICWSLDSELDVDFDVMEKAAPQAAAYAMIGMLSVGGTHSAKSYERRLMLMAKRHIIAAADLPPQLIQCAADCYMHCSYVDAPDKHEIKRIINEKMRSTICASLPPITEREKKSVRKDRPTILMPLEWFGSHHAMYRCYAPAITELRQKFRMVALFRDNQHEVDDAARAVFDKCIAMPKATASIDAVVNAINEEQPDIIYYPSLGMATWYVAISNFRLAPIQVMAPGHPATSMSKCIDYIVSDGDLFGDPQDYTEQLVPLPVGTTRYIGRANFTKPERQRKNDDVVRLAIPAMLIKLIPPFLSTLARIQSESKRKVEYHFFPNMTGMSHWSITKELRRWFKSVVVWPREDYPTYMQWLTNCDGVLSTFPFGGTNSTIDAFLCGLPVVTLEGPHVHGRSDASMMRRVQLPDWLITHTVEEYVAAAHRLIEVDLEREALRRHLDEVGVEREFYGESPEHLKGGYIAAFTKLFEENLNDQAG